MREEIRQRTERIRKSEVPDGYKETKVGIIPEEWGVKKLNEITFYQEGPGVRNYQYTRSGVKLLNVGNLQDNRLNLNTTDRYISEEEAYGKYKHFLVDEGDLVIACSGITEESFNKKIAFAKKEHLPLCMNTSTMRFKTLNKNKLDIRHLFYYLQTEIFTIQVLRVLTGSAQFNFGPSHLKYLMIKVPPLPEQTAIAEVLSTADKTIEKTEQLIEQKEQKKKWLMQNLLTGKVRLPEYDICPVPIQERVEMINDGIVPEGYKQTKVGIIPREWEVNKLGKYCKITTGSLNANAMVPNGEYRFYTCAAEYFFIDKYRFDDEALLISGNGANVGYVHYYKGKFDAYQRTYVLTSFSKDIIYTKYYLEKSLKRRIDKEKNAGNTPYIRIGAISNMIIPIPNLTKQTAIAKVLSTADKEIDLLNQKLEALKEQKKALMQLLLTGIVRTNTLILQSDPEKEGVSCVE